MVAKPSPRSGNLREACIAEAFRIIEDAGLEALSLREVARRLGVSHQAPYKHFPSRDHIVAEILAQRGRHPGLVPIFSAMESCKCFKPWCCELF